MVNRRGKLIIALALMLLWLTACSANLPSFTDDFSDPASGWGAASHETYVRGYQQGEYLIQIDVPQWFVWATAGYNYTDVQIDAAVRTAGQLDNHYGLICRYDEQNFYYFAVSADGYYGIFRHEADGTMHVLTGKDMLFSPLINREGNGNALRIICQGSTLSLYFNDTILAEVEDDALAKGDIGMAAGSVTASSTSIWFDDFEVNKP
ncbi:MAG: hypothetical protein P1S60_03900 [Anaerolineae bacterium]|nr:hypothetical protein [Anaerolineae bacterium]